MPIDLATVLPILLPRAVAWATAQSQTVLEFGLTLKESGLEIARTVGVRQPQDIRVGVVDRLPMPEDALLREAAVQTGLLGPNMLGLTLGYAVLVCRGHETSPRLLSHEFRHVHQYEVAGSIEGFLPVYLQEIIQYGYAAAPSEIDARNHEDPGA